MKNDKREKFLADRLTQLYALTGVSFNYMGGYFSASPSSLYNMMSGRRRITNVFAKELGALHCLSFEQVIDPGFKLTKNLQASPDLEHYRKVVIDFKGMKKASKFIMDEIYSSQIFFSWTDVKTVRNKCQAHKRKFSSKQVGQALDHLAKRGYFLAKSDNILKKDGTKGIRKVNYYKRNTLKKPAGKG